MQQSKCLIQAENRVLYSRDVLSQSLAVFVCKPQAKIRSIRTVSQENQSLLLHRDGSPLVWYEMTTILYHLSHYSVSQDSSYSQSVDFSACRRSRLGCSCFLFWVESMFVGFFFSWLGTFWLGFGLFFFLFQLLHSSYCFQHQDN